MSFLSTAIIGSGVIGAGASLFAANKQSSAASNAINVQQGEFNTALGKEQPFITAGTKAAGTLSDLLTPGANMSSILQNIPGFSFLNKLTQEGVSNQGTVTGLGGNTLLAGSQAGTQLALSQGWQPIVNALQGLVTTGAGSAGNLGNQAVQTGSNIGSNLVGIGNAQAGAATSAGASIGNALTTAALLSKLTSNNGMFGNGENLGNLGGTAGNLSAIT